MATAPKTGRPKPQSRSVRPNSDSYRIPVDVVPVAEPKGEDLMGVLGWIVAVVLVALMLPVLAFLYLDVLETKAEVKAEVEKVERMRREHERQHRHDSPELFGDNPVFDRPRIRMKEGK